MSQHVTTGHCPASQACVGLDDNVQAWSMSTGYRDVAGVTERRVHLKVCHKSCSLLSFNNGALCSLDRALSCQGPTHVLDITVPHTLSDENFAIAPHPILYSNSGDGTRMKEREKQGFGSCLYEERKRAMVYTRGTTRG